MKMYAVLVLLGALYAGCTQTPRDDGESIFVSILPQRYFVQQIVGDTYDVHVMVRPGHSPATYEVLPRQMVQLSDAVVYFRVGVPFEDSWMEKIAEANPDMKIVDTRTGISLRTLDTFRETVSKDAADTQENGAAEHEHGAADPHIWLSPEAVKIQAETICETMCTLDPDNTTMYRENLARFHADLDKIQQRIHRAVRDMSQRKFMVFHPSFGYFADEFGLTQIPVEVEGKEPSPAQMRRMIDYARRENISVIFVQKQFSTHAAEAIADEIGGAVVAVDPLAENYPENMRHIADALVESTQ